MKWRVAKILKYKLFVIHLIYIYLYFRCWCMKCKRTSFAASINKQSVIGHKSLFYLAQDQQRFSSWKQQKILICLCKLNFIFCVTCCKQRWHLGITSPSPACPSVPLPVCLSVRTSLFASHFLFCNNSSSTDAIEMKLHMWIELKRVKSNAHYP